MQAFRHNADYRVIPYDLKKIMQTVHSSPANSGTERGWLNNHDSERRSVFVGGLPTDLGDLEGYLEEIMGEVGEIQDIQVIRKEPTGGEFCYCPMMMNRHAHQVSIHRTAV
jgi:hypothetical protein